MFPRNVPNSFGSVLDLVLCSTSEIFHPTVFPEQLGTHLLCDTLSLPVFRENLIFSFLPPKKRHFETVKLIFLSSSIRYGNCQRASPFDVCHVQSIINHRKSAVISTNIFSFLTNLLVPTFSNKSCVRPSYCLLPPSALHFPPMKYLNNIWTIKRWQSSPVCFCFRKAQQNLYKSGRFLIRLKKVMLDASFLLRKLFLLVIRPGSDWDWECKDLLYYRFSLPKGCKWDGFKT